MARAIGVEHGLPLGGIHWTGHQRMFWSHGHVDHDWTGSRNNVYLGQNSSNCILTIAVFMVCKFALIFKSLENTYFLFLVHWQGKEETRKCIPLSGSGSLLSTSSPPSIGSWKCYEAAGLPDIPASPSCWYVFLSGFTLTRRS